MYTCIPTIFKHATNLLYDILHYSIPLRVGIKELTRSNGTLSQAIGDAVPFAEDMVGGRLLFLT